MTPCVMESPLAGCFYRNLLYARWCMRALLDLGYSPFASHLLYPQSYDDEEVQERRDGIKAGQNLSRIILAHPEAKHIFCVDFGMSDGMRAARGFSPDSQQITFSLPDRRHEYWAAFRRGDHPKATRGACYG